LDLLASQILLGLEKMSERQEVVIERDTFCDQI